MEQENRFESQAALIVGGASGTGFAIARRLGTEGARVMLVDHDGAAGESCANALDSMGIEGRLVIGDPADPAVSTFAVRSAVQIWGRLDVLVTLATGAGLESPSWETPVEVFDRVYATNMRGLFLFAGAAVPWMLKRGYGRIVCVVPHAPGGGARRAAFSATAAGVGGMVKSLAKELAGSGVLANCVAGDGGSAEAAASAAAFLASPECTFTTGSVWYAGGGG
ncbi:MAG: SDR family oxidoreductase [SAR202 cluster bacterium]|nr:SDR family oxidoreductase [SAR202 cluster bacterium]